MSGDPTHRHDELHRGVVPDDQLATGTASDTFVPISNGDGTRTWAAQTLGFNPHTHTNDVFAGDGATTAFVLSFPPNTYPLVSLNGSVVWDGWNYTGSTITFTVAPPNGSQILAYYDYTS